ncbi:MAG: AAA family ATPase [Gammaproteobacteria bacterium]|nr:AAA family ATPase [Gammaproteobacteria bacterium]MDH5801734.1 AAA family ATPase [Gammaproteobacteria bacterium]
MSEPEYDNRNSPSYLAHYAMTRAPFSTKHEADMIYPEPSRTQRLDILMHLTQYSNEMLLVTGPEGIGKTTLMHQFLDKAHDSWKICSVDAYPMMDNDRMIQHIARGFGFTLDNSTRTKFEKLSHQLELQLAGTQTVVVVVDNAHTLTTRTLGLLTSISKIHNAKSAANIRVILFCEPQIKIQFASSDMEKHKQSDIRKIDLPPFTEQHTRGLLLHRTKVAGLNSENTFTDAAVAKLYKQSDGLPGVIVDLAHRVLFEMTPIKRRVKPKLGQRKGSSKSTLGVAVGVLVFIILLLIILFQNELNALYLSHLSRSPNPPELSQAKSSVQPLRPQSATPKEPKAQNAEAVPSTIVSASKVSPSNVPTSNTSETDTALSTTNTSETTLSTTVATGSQVQIAQNISIAPMTEDKRFPNSEQWLMQQNPDAFTLQLLAGYEKRTIDKFLNQNDLPSTKLAYYQSTNRGKHWHSLVFGLYPDYRSATHAVAQLPEPLQHAKPWIRQLKNIQKDIRLARDNKF